MAWSRTSRHERGYGSRWVRLRRSVLERDGHLCQLCLKRGRPTPATEVDHVTPKAKGGSDDEENLMAICGSCHKEKTAADSGAKPRLRFDAAGFPIW